MPRRLARSTSKREPNETAGLPAIVGAVVLFAACTGADRQPATSPATECEADAQPGFACAWDAGCHCISLTTNLAPVANIRFQIGMPRDDSDYPYGPGALPSENPQPGSTVYLSSDGSSDPQGGAFTVFWNVQDPNGTYLPIDPDPKAARVSFSPPRLGTYTITLEATQVGGLGQTGQASLTLPVEPNPCAPDGFSQPCSDALLVEGGQFYMGSPDGLPNVWAPRALAQAALGNDDERPRHAVTVAPFLLDKYEVTVGRFRRYLSRYGGFSPPDGAGANPFIPGSGWQSDSWMGTIATTNDHLSFELQECGGPWTPLAGANEARPVTCVDWYQAFAMCVSEGKRLPTEEEWEYAAAGGSEQRTYPWGEAAPTPRLAVYGCLFDGVPGCSDADLPVVGSVPLGAGRWGQLDLAGSVWEWTLDMYGTYTTDPCDNCANLTAGMGRVFRGGDWSFDDPSYLRAAVRLGFDPAFPDPSRGFRCAQSLVDAGPPVSDGGTLEAGESGPPDQADGGASQPDADPGTSTDAASASDAAP